MSPPQRNIAIDFARGLAILGMFGAHLLITRPFTWADPGSWPDLVHGRSSILFAVLAGFSIGIITGGQHPTTGQDLLRARIRILVRAVIIFGIGLLLTSLGTPILIILEYYAVMFVFTLPFLTLRPEKLLLTAAIIALGVPFISQMLVNAGIPETFASGSLPPSLTFLMRSVVDLTFTGSYPAGLWLCFSLTGLALSRISLTTVKNQLTLAATGITLMLVGYGLGTLVTDPTHTAGAVQAGGNLLDFSPLLTREAHSGSQFEVIGSTGFALTIIACSFWIAPRLRGVIFPITATGALALSAYVGHVIAFSALAIPPSSGGPTYFTFVVVTVSACTLWAVMIGRGPLEALLNWLSRKAASVVRTP